MKTATDPRHQKRLACVQALFAYSFDPEQKRKIEEIVGVLPEIDTRIAEVAKERPIDDISKVDLAILREAVFELLYQQQNPSIIIDEAVEIARSIGSDASPKFINAVLSKISKL